MDYAYCLVTCSYSSLPLTKYSGVKSVCLCSEDISVDQFQDWGTFSVKILLILIRQFTSLYSPVILLFPPVPESYCSKKFGNDSGLL